MDAPPPGTAERPEDGQAIGGRQVARGVGTTLMARLGALIEIVAQPLYVAMFGLASYGLYAVLWAVVNLLENVFDLGMTSALQRTVPQAGDDRQAVASLRAALLMGVGPCLVVALVVCLAAPAIAPWFNVRAADADLVVPALQFFIWALPLWALVEIATSALRARQVFGAEIRLRVFWEQVIRLCLAAIAWVAGFGLFGLFVAHMVSLLATAALSIRLLARQYPLAELKSGPVFGSMFHETAKAGLSVLPANIVARLFGDAPAILLNMLLPGAEGARAGGLFTIARKISSVVQMVRIAFVYVLAPLASSAERADRNQVREIYAYAVRLITAVSLPLTLVLAAGSGVVLSLFGPDAHAAQAAVIILLMARAGEAIVGISLPVLQVIAAYKHQLTAGIVGLIAAVAAGFVLFPLGDGLTMVSLAVAIGILVAAVIPMIQLYHHEQLLPFDEHLSRTLVHTVPIAFAALGLALLAAQLPDWLAFPVVIVLGLGATWASLRFALPLHDRQSLGKTGRKLRLFSAAPAG